MGRSRDAFRSTNAMIVGIFFVDAPMRATSSAAFGEVAEGECGVDSWCFRCEGSRTVGCRIFESGKYFSCRMMKV